MVPFLLCGCTEKVQKMHQDHLVAKIITTDKVEDIETELAQIDENTLVVFDCDGVLVANTIQIMKKKNREMSRKLFEKYMGKSDVTEVLSIMVSSGQGQLVNNKMPILVKNLQDKNIRVVVLTGFSASPFGHIKDPKVWRTDNLNSFGYHFEKSWPNTPQKKFSTSSAFYKGVIFCGDLSKDVCLNKFIAHSGMRPKKIIFIDDGIGNIHDVAEYCKSDGIQFVGIEYLEAEKIVPNFPFSEKTAEFQFRTLKDKGIWLSDEEAAKAVVR
jgi:hypothetical protein